MSWYKKISEVEIGMKIENKKNGKGMVTKKSAKKITVTFESGLIITNTYKNSDAPFNEYEF